MLVRSRLVGTFGVLALLPRDRRGLSVLAIHPSRNTQKLAGVTDRCYEWNAPRSPSWRCKSSAILQLHLRLAEDRKKCKRILAISDRHVLPDVESSSSARILSLALAYA